MRKKVAKKIGRAVRAVGSNKTKAGLAAAGVVLAAGAIILAKKRRSRRARNDAEGDVDSNTEKSVASGEAGSTDAALDIPVAMEADTVSESGSNTRATTRRGRMVEAPVAGARFNQVRNDRKETRG
jgi:hypothetical protein